MVDKHAYLIRTSPKPTHNQRHVVEKSAGVQQLKPSNRHPLQVIEPTLTIQRHLATRQPDSRYLSSLTGGVRNVLDHVTSTVNYTKNNLKEPRIWVWSVGPPKQTGNTRLRKDEVTIEDSGYDTFPYVGNWKARARYRYLVQIAPEGTGFVAVGHEEPQLDSTLGTGRSTNVTR